MVSPSSQSHPFYISIYVTQPAAYSTLLSPLFLSCILTSLFSLAFPSFVFPSVFLNAFPSASLFFLPFLSPPVEFSLCLSASGKIRYFLPCAQLRSMWTVLIGATWQETEKLIGDAWDLQDLLIFELLFLLRWRQCCYPHPLYAHPDPTKNLDVYGIRIQFWIRIHA